MGIFRGSTPQILQDLGVAGIEYQVTLTLTPEQIRSLNTLPVDLVVPTNAATFLAPGQCVFVGAQGSGAYSASPTPAIQYAGDALGVGAINIDANSWDGSAAQESVVPDLLAKMITSPPGNISAGPGASLQITSGGDVTSGDAPCTIILTYVSYDLTGLL